MGLVTIRGVCQKNGSTYRRFKVKRDGKWVDEYVPLPDPSSPLFATEKRRVEEERLGKRRQGPMPGSFWALAQDFRAALAIGWTRKRKKKGAKPLAKSTIDNYLRYVSMFEDETFVWVNPRNKVEMPVRDMSVKGLRPTHVYQLRDSMAETPGKANNWLNVLKLMMVFACERDWRGDNPADQISPLPIGEHEPWPSDVLTQALDRASPMLRLAIVTGLCTGQRVSDVILIQHNWLKTGIMELSQLKTDVDVAVPVHPWWRQEIDKLDRCSTTVLYDRFGRPFRSEDRIQERIRRLMHELGFVDENNQALYTFHGLRKNACCYLLEAGLSDTDVGEVLGMTPDTVRHYGKRSRALMVARRVAGIMSAISLADMGANPIGGIHGGNVVGKPGKVSNED